MLELFWRRKNARLVERLNSAVETSERVRQQYENRPRRAVIDTSYVDALAAQERADRRRPHLVAQDAADADPTIESRYETEAVHAAAVEDYADEVVDSDLQYEAVRHDGWSDQQEAEESEELALVREAVEQLELANAREADALAREAEATAHIEALLARVAELETAHDGQNNAHVDVTALDRRIEELETKIATEQAARRATKAECELAQVSLREARAEIARLTEQAQAPVAQVQTASATPPGDAELQLEVTSLRERIKRAEIAVAKETAARREMEASRDRARLNVEELEHELETVRARAAVTSEHARQIAEAQARERQLSEALDDAAARVQGQQAELAQERAAREAAEARHVKLSRKCDALQAEIADLREQVSAMEAETETLGSAAAKLADLEAQVAAARREAADHTETLRAERMAREVAESTANQLETKIAALRDELAAARSSSADEAQALRARIEDADTAHKAAEARAAEVALQLDALETDLAAAGAALLAEGDRREAAERQARDLLAEAGRDDGSTERVAAAHRERDAACARTDELEFQLQVAQQRASDAEAARRLAAERAAEAESELAALVESGTAAAQAASDARSHEETVMLRAELEDVRRQLEGSRAAQVSMEEARLAQDDAVEELAAAKLALEHDLAQSRQHAAHLDAQAGTDKAGAEAAQTEIETLKDRVARLDVSVAHERAARREAEAELDRMAATVSEARAEMASLRVAAERFAEIQRREKALAALDTESDDGSSPSADEDRAWMQGGGDTPVEAAGDHTAGEPVDEPNDAQDNLAVLVEAYTAPSDSNGTASDTPKPPRADAVKRAIAAATSKRGLSTPGSNRRNQSRTSAQMQVTLWKDGMSHALQCTLIDKSSTGAKVELHIDSYGPPFSVGDRMTLTFNYALERTSVFCDVMWIDGNKCGVKYYGQFITQQTKPVRKAAGGGRFGRS